MLVGEKDSTPFVKSVAPLAVLVPGSQVKEELLPSVKSNPEFVREIFPPFMLTLPFTVKFPVIDSVLIVVQESEPPAFTVTWLMVWFVLTVTACPEAMVILSAGDGDPDGDQMEEVFQSPDAIEIRLMAEQSNMIASEQKIAARNFEKMFCLFFIQLYGAATDGFLQVFVLF